MIRKIEKLIEKLNKEFPFAGLSLVVINNYKTIAKDSYGYADIKNNIKVNNDTIFDIASNSKAFTTLLGAIAKDKGIFDWNKHVKEYLPDFGLYDSFADANVASKDLALHRTGLPGHDLMSFNEKFDRKKYIKRLKYLLPTKKFREGFMYNNQMYVALGAVFENVFSKEYKYLVNHEIADKIGMDIYFRNDNVKPYQCATPYMVLDKKLIKDKHLDHSATDPCGGLRTNINSIENWLNFLIGKGTIDSKKIISRESFYEMIEPQIETYRPLPPSYDDQMMYGYGWQILSKNKVKIVNHGGTIVGFQSLIGFIPEKNSGYGIICNMLGSPLIFALQELILDYLCDGTDRDYYEMFKDYSFPPKGKPNLEEEKKPFIGKFSDLAGLYFNEGYGVLEILESQNSLMFRYGELEKILVHHSKRTFMVFLEEFGMKIKLNFALDNNSISCDILAGSNANVVFLKKGEK